MEVVGFRPCGQAIGLRLKVYRPWNGLGFRVRVPGSWCRVQGLGFWLQGSGCKV